MGNKIVNVILTLRGFVGFGLLVSSTAVVSSFSLSKSESGSKPSSKT